MKNENNKNENIWTREFNPSVDIVYYIDIIIKYIKIIAKYIYDKILTRWGIFLISLMGFGYVSWYFYIYIKYGDVYPHPDIVNQIQFYVDYICRNNYQCNDNIQNITYLSLIFIPIFLYSTIFLFYKNKEKFEKWRLFTLWYLFWYILIGMIVLLTDTGGGIGDGILIILFFITSLPIYSLVSSWIISKKLGIFMTLIILFYVIIMYLK